MSLIQKYVVLPWKRLAAVIASEHFINTVRRNNPGQLQEYRKYIDRKDFPWKAPVENEVFWRTYRQMLGYITDVRKSVPKSDC